MAEGPEPLAKCEFNILFVLISACTKIFLSELVHEVTAYSARCELVISPPTVPPTPLLKELSNALDSIVNWYSLGVKLGLEDHELSAIEQDYRGDCDRSKLEMLSRWLRNAKLPTWKAVIDALQQMGEHAVALKIQAKYCSSSTVTTETGGTYVFTADCKGENHD